MNPAKASALLALLLSAPAWGVEPKARLKPMGPRGGFATQKEKQRSTADEQSPASLDTTLKALENIQTSPYITPGMRQDLQGMIEQAQALQGEAAAGIEYSRPAGSQSPQSADGWRDPRRGMSSRASAPLDLRPGESRAPTDISSLRDSGKRGPAAAASGELAPPNAGANFSSLREPGGAPFFVTGERRAVWSQRGADADRTLALDPRDPSALHELTRAELGQGRFLEAAAASERAIRVSPQSAEAYMMRAMARERLGDPAGSLADVKHAAALDPARYASRAAAAEAGASLFDPANEESWGLLEGMSPPQRTARFPWGALLGFLALAGAAASGAAVWRLWKDLPPDSRRLLLSRWRKVSRGETSPNLRAATPMPPRREAAPKVGERLGAKYEIVRVVGRDGTVEIWKGHDRMLDRDVLLKRLYAGPDSEELDLRRADARQAATLHHPNIAELYEILELPQGLFAVYEYASGKSLRAVISEKGALSPRQARDVITPICRALEHAHHRGVVHGGLSPDRVILTRQGYVKVLDFVLARTTAAGIEAYAAPETKRGAPTPASDVYSLGMCFYEMLAGKPPEDIEDFEPPPAVAGLLDSALDLDVRTRLSSARQFLENLKTLNVRTMPPRQLETPEPAENPLVEIAPQESVDQKPEGLVEGPPLPESGETPPSLKKSG